DTPVTWVRLAEGIAGGIRDDKLGFLVSAVDDGVLSKGAPEVDSLLAVDIVHKPSRFPPSHFRFIFIANALFYSVAAQDEEFTHDLVALFINTAWQKHGARIVYGDYCKSLTEKRRQ